MSVKWKLPGPNEPGFLKRRLELTGLLDLEPSQENLAKLMDFLAQFVEDENPRKALLEASRIEYSRAIVELLGYGNTVPDPKDGSSGQP